MSVAPAAVASGPSSTPSPPLAAQAPASATQPLSSPRWSGDGWLFWRSGGRGLAAGGALAPSYGGSQAGAVLRYSLAPDNPRQPVAYVRAVRALDVGAESDLAAGLALRPIAALPVTAHAEVRVRRRGSRVEAGPAAFVAAGVEDVPLAAGFAARGYAQAGYVAGRDATFFADGSITAERALVGSKAQLSAGAGAWGGAQEGAARLDIGPTASARFRLRHGTIRLSADYRIRVASNAGSGSGAAVTLAAGF